MRQPERVVVAESGAMAREAAALVDRAIRTQPDLVLALPTGNTPVGMYTELVRLHRETGTDWGGVTVFNLDEYLGVAPDHPESYAAYMQQHLYRHVNVPPSRQHIPNGLADDPDREVARYEAAIEAAGGVDLAVLGIGTNGHIGFNEPAQELIAPTHVATLTEETWQRNFPHLVEAHRADQLSARPFRQAYTMGVGSILQARHIILLASGSDKRAAIARAFQGPVTTQVPASLLQLHPRVTLVLDEAAA